MNKLLLFGGTSEEHELIKALAIYPVAITLCVASEYGRALLPEESSKLSIRAGRMDTEQMMDLIRKGSFSCVVDATHPYATEVTKNLKAAASETGIKYLRLLRESSIIGDCITVNSVSQAAEVLKELEGAVLITTGSKELAAYTRVSGYKERLYPRVLPTVESINACLTLGFPANHIIAMQGPFSKELNLALMNQFNIKTLVTKDGGAAGGFPEKAEAARELGIRMIVIRRPDEEGLPQNKVVQRILEILEEKQ